MLDHNRNISPAVKQTARRLRREQTPMECRLWSALRRRQLDGLRFRRQRPIGRFIVDFYCAEHLLIIEIDGESHKYQIEYDEIRTAWLQAQGFHMLRFSNGEVQHNLEGVLASIKLYVSEL